MSEATYATLKDGYYTDYEGIFSSYVGGLHAADKGIKLHISVAPNDADRMAATILPQMRRLKLPHKIVKNLDEYLKQLQTDQRGKFITIYCVDKQQALKAAETFAFAVHGKNFMPGPVPTTRQSNHTEREMHISAGYGLLYARLYKKND